MTFSVFGLSLLLFMLKCFQASESVLSAAAELSLLVDLLFKPVLERIIRTIRLFE